jgi:hypothetical protein
VSPCTWTQGDPNAAQAVPTGTRDPVGACEPQAQELDVASCARHAQVYVRLMERAGATPGRGIGAFFGRVALGIVTFGLLGLSVGLVSKIIWDPNCENDCDVLWVICTIIGLLVGIFAGVVVGIVDRHRRSRRQLRVLLWTAGIACVTIVVALLFGGAETPPPY